MTLASIQSTIKRSRGFALPALLVIMVVCTAIFVGWSQLSVSTIRTVGADKVRTTSYNQAESGMNIALSWLRENSASMFLLFTQANFCNNFTRSAGPSFSANDPNTGSFAVPSRIRWNSAPTFSPLLTNNSSLGTTSFQNVGAFNTVSSFNAVNFGNNLVKITLVDALPVSTSASTTCPTITTDFYPVFRIDSMTGNQSGTRVFGYVSGDMQQGDGLPGFYGATGVSQAQDCASFNFTGPPPANVPTAQQRAQCTLASGGNISFANNSEVYGTVKAVGSITAGHQCSTIPSLPCTPTNGTPNTAVANPFAGRVNPFAPGEWCSTHASAGALVPTCGSSTPMSPPAAGACNTGFTLPNNCSVVLGAGTYYINGTLNFGNNASINLPPLATLGSGKVIIHFLSMPVSGGWSIINANNAVNTTAPPSRMEMNYWGSQQIRLNGNSNFAMAFWAPNALVQLQGNTNYYGALLANTLNNTGSANMIYDESMGFNPTTTDVTYALRNVEETYR
jgi:Tfp pilus assembly protein PilX